VPKQPPYALRCAVHLFCVARVTVALLQQCVTYLQHLTFCDRLAAIAMQRVPFCALCVYANVKQTPFKTKAKQYQYLPNTSHSKALPAMCKLFLCFVHFYA